MRVYEVTFTKKVILTFEDNPPRQEIVDEAMTANGVLIDVSVTEIIDVPNK